MHVLDPATLATLESALRKYNNKLGGGEGVEGLYGTLTVSSLNKVLEALAKWCGLGPSSRLVDVGAGIGRALVQALVHPGLGSVLGVEVDSIKAMKAGAFMALTISELQKKGILQPHLMQTEVVCSAIEQVPTLDPCTHAYSFWEGIPTKAKTAFGRLFQVSSTLRAVAVVQHAMRQDPAEVMRELGFGTVVLLHSFPVVMSGSGSSFTAYIFTKAAAAGGMRAGMPVSSRPSPCRGRPILCRDPPVLLRDLSKRRILRS